MGEIHCFLPNYLLLFIWPKITIYPNVKRGRGGGLININDFYKLKKM